MTLGQVLSCAGSSVLGLMIMHGVRGVRGVVDRRFECAWWHELEELSQLVRFLAVDEPGSQEKVLLSKPGCNARLHRGGRRGRR